MDQRITGYATCSKTTRVLESIQREEYNKLLKVLMHIVDSMAQWLGASLWRDHDCKVDG